MARRRVGYAARFARRTERVGVDQGKRVPFSFEGVVVEAGGSEILRVDALEVPASGITVVTGPSGSGKSTLLRLCNRLISPTTGVVRFRGVDIATINPRELRRKLGLVSQRAIVFPGTVRDNLLAALDPSDWPDDETLRARLVGLSLKPDYLSHDASRLSGGEAQRVCLLRSLLVGPEVLLADEPTSALDDESERVIVEHALDLAGAGMAMLWVTHDPASAQRLASAVIEVSAGSAMLLASDSL